MNVERPRPYPLARRRAARLAPAALAFSLSLSLALAPACSSSKGIRVDVELGGLRDMVETLAVTITLTGGNTFSADNPTPAGPAKVALSYPSASALLMTFSKTNLYVFESSFSFRIETGNTRDVPFTAQALASDIGGNLIGAATAPETTLPAGGEARITLSFQNGNPDGGNPDGGGNPGEPIDLSVAGNANVTIQGADVKQPIATVAICNLTSYNSGELVVGVPTATSPTTEGAGAVYVLPGGTTGPVDLGTLTGREFHVFGVNSGDQLGASIGCVDVDNDSVDDLVIGAPGAYGMGTRQPAGRVYVIQGRSSLLTSTAIDLASNGADLEWVGGTPGAGLGSLVFATLMPGGANPEILISAPGEATGGMVHLMSVSGFPRTRAPQVLSGTTGHVTFAGVKPAAMATGDLDGDSATASGFEVILGDPAANSTTGVVYVFADVDPGAASAFDVAGSGATGPQLKIAGGRDNDAFGAAVLAFDLWGGGTDLLVGAPGELASAGAVRIYQHDADIFANRMAKGPLKVTAPGGRFGSVLAGAVSGGGASTNLLVGAPTTARVNGTNAGAVYVFRPTFGDLPVLSQTIVGAETGDRLGSALVGGPVGNPGAGGSDPDSKADLFAAAPGARSGLGVAYVRYGR